MREIKFRAWNTGKKEMITTFDGITQNSIGISKADNLSLLMNSYSGADIFRPTWGRPVILMQYTGLKDKNGKEIYEGDIVLSKFNDKDSVKYIVEWDICNPCFVLKSIEKFSYGHNVEYDFIQCDLRKNEIIGNIYENPELLK